MRDRMERFASFPFSAGCVSQSSVEVVDNQPKSKSAPTSEIQSNNGSRMKSSFLPLPKPNISAGIQKVIKSIKSLSSLFQFYREEDDDEEIEMEIGFPTDVQHVAHIGWDGFNSGTTTAMKSWNKGPEILSLPTVSLRQFELAMAAQADCPH